MLNIIKKILPERHIRSLTGSFQKSFLYFPVVFLPSFFTKARFRQVQKKKELFFTIAISPNAGFTDQLIKFISLFKLGRFLGMKFLFTPIHAKSNLVDFPDGSIDFEQELTGNIVDVFDFSGFNSYFRRIYKQPESLQKPFSKIVISTSAAQREKNTSLTKEIHLIRKQIVKQAAHCSSSILVILDPKQLLVTRIFSGISDRVADFSFRDVFLDRRDVDPFPERFQTDKVNILLHIRQGDTAVVETPWGSYIRVWGRMLSTLYKEYPSVDAMDHHQIITINEFNTFYSQLRKETGLKNTVSSLHSDGFTRAFWKIDRHINHYPFSRQQILELREWRKNYNERAYKSFLDYPELIATIGERSGQLRQLIHDFYHADIVITGSHQHMLAKLYACSYIRNDGPVMVVLYKKQVPDFHGYHNAALNRNTVFVNLESYDIRQVVKKVEKKLKKAVAIKLNA